MKFGLYLEEHIISEWREFYINYKLLKQILKLLEKRYKHQSNSISYYFTNNLNRANQK